MTTYNQDQLHVREEPTGFIHDTSLDDPETLALLEENEQTVIRHLASVGVSDREFHDALDRNPDGFIEWVALSVAIRH